MKEYKSDLNKVSIQILKRLQIYDNLTFLRELSDKNVDQSSV